MSRNILRLLKWTNFPGRAGLAGLNSNPIRHEKGDSRPFKATIAIDITDVVEKKIDMIACHESQVFEWLPYNSGVLDQVPRGAKERRKWLAERMYARFSRVADSCRETLGDCYGEKRGKEIRFAEAIMISEYGRPLKDEDRPHFFPFLKK